MNINTNPELWAEDTVIEDKEGRRYSWSLPHGFRGSQHLTSWGRKLLCGQQGNTGGTYDHPFGSERACQVCCKIALKLIKAREDRLAKPVKIELTQDQLEELHSLLNRAIGAYESDGAYWADRAAAVDTTDTNYATILANLHYTERMVRTGTALRDRVITSKIS